MNMQCGGLWAAAAIIALTLVLGCLEQEPGMSQTVTTFAPTTSVEPVPRSGIEPGSCESPSLDERTRDDCFKKKALTDSRAADCGRISTTEGRDECSFKVAAKLRDRSVCAGIADEGIRKACESKT
jgi:hypothetical protein